MENIFLNNVNNIICIDEIDVNIIIEEVEADFIDNTNE